MGKKEPQKVSAEQSKNIMDNLLGELDQQDDEDLQDIQQVRAGKSMLEEEDQEMVFNKDDLMNLKYNVAVTNPEPVASKKRGISDITPIEKTKPRGNPFQKSESKKVFNYDTHETDESHFKQAEAPVLQEPE